MRNMANEDLEEPPVPELDDGPSNLVGDRFRILVDSRLPELDLEGAEAVAVQDEKQGDYRLFARVCAPLALPRVEEMTILKHMRDAAVLRPLEWGPVRMVCFKRK